MYQIWRIYLDLWGHDCKKWVWPTFGCKLGQIDPIVMQLKLDMSCHLLNVFTKFQIDISKHVEEKSGKPGRTDGRTDRRTDGHCHGIIRPFFKRAYKNFMRYWPFVRGIHRSPVNSPHNGQWRKALMFSLICAWINSWVNHREDGDLRHHGAHYEVIVMGYTTDIIQSCTVMTQSNITWYFRLLIYRSRI